MTVAVEAPLVTEYTVSLERFDETYNELEPLYKEHYLEMASRFDSFGVKIAPYNPRLDEYIRACEGGYLLTFVLRRVDREPVGYSNIYITHDMHNHELIGQEDTIYILPNHRGNGRKLIHFVHSELRKRKVKRLNITTSTDLRVAKLLEHMGYKHTAHAMTFILGD